jgi:hypothetical protein
VDYSCYLKVTNTLSETIYLASESVLHGYWETRPPDSIAPGASASFTLKDRFGFYGAEGTFTYRATLPKISVTFNSRFGCTTGEGYNYAWNSVSVPTIGVIGFRAKTDGGSWKKDIVPAYDHPLYVEYTISYKAINTSPSVEMVYARGDYAIQNSKGDVVDYVKPVWGKGANYDDGAYSTRPAAFSSRRQDALTVYLKLDSAMVNVPFRLTGSKGASTFFRSDVLLGNSGDMPVIASAVSARAPLDHYGDFTWFIEPQTTLQSIRVSGTTRLEMYWLPGRPGLMFTRGVWVTLLRILAPLVAAGVSEDEAAATLAGAVFSPKEPQYQKKYASKDGAAHYVQGRDGGFFDISKYFGGATLPANCYDQAAALQTCLGAFGVISSWAFQEPFGFINTTNLLGYGNCNNPFFLHNGTKLIVSENDPYRTMFGNHSYLIRSGKVLDTCQGPYVGKESIASYISTSIDLKTTLYPSQNPPFNRPGTAADITSEPGVTSVQAPTPAPEVITGPNARFANGLLAEARQTPPQAPATPERFFEGPSELFEQAIAAADFTTLYQRDAIGRHGYLLSRTINSAGSDVDLAIWVSSAGRQEALLRLLEATAAIQLPLTSDNARSISDIGDWAVAIGPVFTRLLWVRHNVFVSTAATGEIDLLPLAQAIDAVITQSTVAADERTFPRLADPAIEEPAVAVGEGITVTVTDRPQAVELALEGDGRIELAAIRGDDYHFRAIAPGEVYLTFMTAQPETLAVTARSITAVIRAT